MDERLQELLSMPDYDLMATARSWIDNELRYEHQLIDALITKFTKAKAQHEEQVRGLVEACEQILVSHYNLYKSTFGENSDPEGDIPRKELKQALSAHRARVEREGEK